MKSDATVVVTTDCIDMRAKMQIADGKPGFLEQLAPRRRLAGFPQILGATRQCPTANVWWFASTAQQDVVAFDHYDSDADEWPTWILAIAHGFGVSALGGSAGVGGGAGGGAFKSSSEGSND